MMLFPRFVCLLSLFIFLEGCTPIYHVHGNLPLESALAKIELGKTTQQQVVAMIGLPTTKQIFQGEGWLYVGERTKNVSFFDPEVIERRITLIQFDDQGIVKSVETRNAGREMIVDMTDKETPTMGRDPSLFKELFSTFGKYDHGKHKGMDTEKPTKSHII